MRGANENQELSMISSFCATFCIGRQDHLFVFYLHANIGDSLTCTLRTPYSSILEGHTV